MYFFLFVGDFEVCVLVSWLLQNGQLSNNSVILQFLHQAYLHTSQQSPTISKCSKHIGHSEVIFNLIIRCIRCMKISIYTTVAC
jgi:hypothetical protein